MINDFRTTTTYASWTGNKLLKLKKLQNSWYFHTLYEVVFETVVGHFSKTYLLFKYRFKLKSPRM